MSSFNNQWVEIFRTGDYGEKGKWTPKMLAAVVSNFKAGVWKPPAVLGHPKNDSPAMGWVDELVLDGETLKAKFGKVQPELESHVAGGRFPNRSAAFYLDPKGEGPVLRHVGFLGAIPPEVKGLEPIKFSDGEFVAIELKEERAMEFTEKQFQERLEAAQKPLLEQVAKLSAKFKEKYNPGAAAAARHIAGGGPGNADADKKYFQGPFGLVASSANSAASGPDGGDPQDPEQVDISHIALQARAYIAKMKALGETVGVAEAVAHIMKSMPGNDKQFAEEKQANFDEQARRGKMITNALRVATLAREYMAAEAGRGYPVTATEAVAHVTAN
jgi:hypothetical protein